MTTNDIRSTGQEILVPTDQAGLAVTGPENLPERHDHDTLEAVEYTLAEFRYKNGLRVVFSYDAVSRDFGLLQEGRIGESAPLVHGEFDTMLEAYLAIAPANLPIPEELLDEAADCKDLTAEVRARAISPTCVTASELELPLASPAVTAASQTCFSTYYSWWDWHDDAEPGLAPETYYTIEFGGKKRYSQSYIRNCTPAGSGSWLWARHRIYYKKANGTYKKHFEGKVAPGYWQAKTKGSIKRWRKVSYDDGWNSSPSNDSLKYTREGRFRN